MYVFNLPGDYSNVQYMAFGIRKKPYEYTEISVSLKCMLISRFLTFKNSIRRLSQFVTCEENNQYSFLWTLKTPILPADLLAFITYFNRLPRTCIITAETLRIFRINRKKSITASHSSWSFSLLTSNGEL